MKIILTNKQKIMLTESMDKTIWLSVDNNEPITYNEFHRINTDRNVEPLSAEEFEMVKNLDVGESIDVGNGVQVKRVIRKNYGPGSKVILTKKVNPAVKIIIKKYPDGRIVDIKVPNGIRFPFSVGQISNRNIETWACVNGYLIDGINPCGEEKVFGIKVSDIPKGHELRMLYPHKFRDL